MYKNKTPDGRNNICGKRIREYRLNNDPKLSQRQIADMLQVYGVDLDKNAIQRIEAGKRYVTDIELDAIAKVLDLDYHLLLKSWSNFL